MKLYYAPGVCASTIHIFCAEANIPVEAIKVDIHNKANQSDDFKKVSPLGAVPILVLDDGTVVSELAAIAIYLADAHPSAFFPAPGATPARAIALRWLCFANATLHPAYHSLFTLKMKHKLTDGPIIDGENERLGKIWQLVEQQLSDHGPYLCGSQPTVADLYVAIVANWKKNLPDPAAATYGPATRKMLAAISQRPAFQTTMHEEGFTYQPLAA